jgi:hypothetical protein
MYVVEFRMGSRGAKTLAVQAKDTRLGAAAVKPRRFW